MDLHICLQKVSANSTFEVQTVFNYIRETFQCSRLGLLWGIDHELDQCHNQRNAMAHHNPTTV